MRFVLLAQGKIAEKVLFQLSKDRQSLLRHNLVGVIGSPLVIENCIKIAGDLGSSTHCISTKSKDEEVLRRLINETNPDYIFSIQYPWIIPDCILSLKKGRFLNLHNAKLPDYRGHNSITHVLLNREKFHTSTLHWMVDKVDRGRVVMEKATQVFVNDTAFSLWSRTVEAACKLALRWFSTVESIEDFPEGDEIVGMEQFYSRDIEQLKQIPEDASFSDIERISRAFYFPGRAPAYFQCDEKKLYLIPEYDMLKLPSEFS